MTLLQDIAHVRTGDKGDISQMSVIASRPEDYAALVQTLTRERIAAHLPGLSCRIIDIYPLPSLHAVNIVIGGALTGGVTRSIAIDPHGKTLGFQLLDLVVTI